MDTSSYQRRWRLRLLDRWEVRGSSGPVSTPYRAQRLIAFLAILGGRPRSVVAGSLWPDSTEDHARSNLRTTAVQVRRLAPGLLEAARDPLSLDAAAVVDLDVLRQGLEWESEPSAEQAAHDLLTAGELLPGWYEDWVLFERERLRQRRMIALDQLSMQLFRQGNLHLALACAHVCVALEPLWESPHRTLVQIHLSAGNRVQALQVYRAFRARSIAEVGLSPDHSFDELIRPLVWERRTRMQHH